MSSAVHHFTQSPENTVGGVLKTTLLEKVELPAMENAEWLIEQFTTDATDWSSLRAGRDVPIGETYTRLFRKGGIFGKTLVMSDTPSEMRDHYRFVRQASGKCLIAGLGIGMVLKNILKKPDVTHVTVVEISQSLIDLVGPYYTDPRVSVQCASILEFKPAKGERYDAVWFDIWDNICSDNLVEMQLLRRRFARRADWKGSWAEAECKYQRQRDR